MVRECCLFVLGKLDVLIWLRVQNPINPKFRKNIVEGVSRYANEYIILV